MKRLSVFYIIIIFLATIKGYPQKQEEILKEIKKKPVFSQKKTFLNLINNAYAETIKRKDEKETLRKEWKKMLGFDIFYPYFKAKETEKWIKEKTSIHLFRVKGEPSFKKDKVNYIFKIKF